MSTARDSSKTLDDLLRAKLKESGLTLTDAKKLQITLATAKEASLLGANFDARGGMRIPYFDIHGKVLPDFFRFRYLEPPMGWEAAKKKPRRYVQPAKSGVRAYFPPLFSGYTWADQLADGSSVVITEGEMKAACATKNELPTIGLGGVWNFKTKDSQLLSELEEIDWHNRPVFLAFDNDVHDKPQVRQALLALADELVTRGAMVFEVHLPPGPAKGIDDFIVAHGVEAFEELVEEAEPMVPPAAALLKLNQEIGYVKNTGSTVVSLDGGMLNSLRTARDDHSNLFHAVEIPDKRSKDLMISREVNTFDEWMKWPHRMEFNGIVYLPGEDRVTSAGAYNSWSGWGVEPLDPTMKRHLSPWHGLLDHIFGKPNGSVEAYEARRWFEQWLAYPIQNPGAKLYSSTVMYGEQGTGKSLIGLTMCRIYGASNRAIVTHENMESEFNAWRRVQFVLAEEMEGDNHRIKAGKMKNLITQDHYLYNQKNLPAIQFSSHENYYITTNSPDAIRVEATDRRFFIWEVMHKASLEFFATYDDWMRGDGPRYLFQYFRTLDLDGFKPTHPAYRTEARESMKQLSASDVGLWVSDLMEEPAAFLAQRGVNSKTTVLRSAQLLALYNNEHDRKITMRTMLAVLKEQMFPMRKIDRYGWVVALNESKTIWKSRVDKRWIKELEATQPRVSSEVPKY